MSYQVPDEPRASPFNRFVVRPSAPLLAAMLCGGWMTWPWFAFNSIAMGSPTRKKELTLCAIALAGTVVLAAIIKAMFLGGHLESRTAVRLVLLAVSTWKLGMAYWVCIVQSRTFEVYTYYGGQARQAVAILGAGYWIQTLLLGSTDDPFWIIILLGGA